MSSASFSLSGPGFDLLVESLPFQEGHRDEGLALGLGDLMDGTDIRVIQRGGGFCLSPKAGLDLFIPPASERRGTSGRQGA